MIIVEILENKSAFRSPVSVLLIFVFDMKSDALNFFFFRLDELLKQPYKVDKSLIREINSKQSSWKAGYYPELEKMTYKQVLMRSGYGNGPISRYIANDKTVSN